jgi:hypothetical protein
MTDLEPHDDRPRMSAAEFASALEHLGLTVREAGRRLGYNERTARRWIKDEEDIPIVVGDYLRFAMLVITWKRLWFERHGINPLVAISRTTCLNALGSEYPELHAVEDENAAFDAIEDEDEEP